MRAAKAARDQQRKTPRDKLFRIKIISMGDMASGKSCLIKRCVTGRARPVGQTLLSALPSIATLKAPDSPQHTATNQQ